MTDVATVARKLGEIIRLAGDLSAEAEHRANSRIMVGGDAMSNLAHVANLEAWRHQQDAAEQGYIDGRRTAWPETVHEDDNDEPVLATLLFWSEERRVAEDQELNDRRATIASEAGFLRWAAEAMWRDEPRWDDFAEDVSKALRKLENVLAAGKRDEATRVRCVADHCETRPRLRRIVTEDGLQDRWKCRACRTWYDGIGFEAARRTQWLDAGDHFVSAVEAESLLLSMRVPPSNVRKWLDAEGLADEDVRYDGRTRMVRWSAVYTRQRAKKTERKGA